VLKIAIKSSSVNLIDWGLLIGTNNCTVQGLAINGFNIGIRINGSWTDAGASSNVIQGNFIGTNIAGTASACNFAPDYCRGNFNHGVYIYSTGYTPNGFIGMANNNLVGGTAPSARNLISGNGYGGVVLGGNYIATATGNLVEGNYLGTDKN